MSRIRTVSRLGREFFFGAYGSSGGGLLDRWVRRFLVACGLSFGFLLVGVPMMSAAEEREE
ncbi:MAG: hypothetical protein ACK559_23445, partial [bacterium]